MRTFLRFAIAAAACAVLAGPARAAEPPATHQRPSPLDSSCVACHSQLDGEALEPTKHTADDIHFLKGLGCSDCHGGNPAAGADGDPDAAHDVKMGWTGRPTRRQIPEFCAKCHADATFMKRFNPSARTDQYNEYRTSVHGRRNAQGDEKTAVCVDCHGVHGIRAVSDTRSSVHPTNLADTCGRCHANVDLMKSYGLPSSQFADYKSSVHARALYEKGDSTAPTCNDCHGSHGAVPPGVDTIANVCGSCHGREATLFRDVEKRKKLDLEACIRCVVCHSNHAVKPPTDDMVGVGPTSTCTACHGEGEPGYKAAAAMGDDLHKLTSRLDQAHDILDRAEQAGVEVGPDKFALQKAHDSLVESRVLVHGFDLERFKLAAEEGIKVAEAGVLAGDQAFAELRFRRNGLALSLVVIAAVIGALVLTIRRIES